MRVTFNYAKRRKHNTCGLTNPFVKYELCNGIYIPSQYTQIGEWGKFFPIYDENVAFVVDRLMDLKVPLDRVLGFGRLHTAINNPHVMTWDQSEGFMTWLRLYKYLETKGI